MCQNCQSAAEQALIDDTPGEQDKIDAEIRANVKMIDGHPFISLVLADSTFRSLGRSLLEEGDVIGLIKTKAALDILTATCSRAAILAEVDAMTAGVDVPEAPQSETLF